MARSRPAPGAAVLRAAAPIIACVTLAVVLPACSSGGSPVSSDPAAPIYRAPTARFGEVHGIALHFDRVTTSNSEGVELTRGVFEGSLRGELTPRFGPITEGTAAPAGGALLDVSIEVDWGNRAGRYFSMGMGGKALITIDYVLKDASGGLLARLHTVDQMSGGVYGGDAKQLVYNAASKWNRWFVNEVLVDAPAR